MSVNWMFVNEKAGEYIFPTQYVNENRPEDSPYSNFIAWMMIRWGNTGSYRLVCDCGPDEEVFYDYIHNKKEVTDKYWKEFCKETGR